MSSSSVKPARGSSLRQEGLFAWLRRCRDSAEYRRSLPQRLINFLRFIGQRFNQDNCFYTAAGLSFYTLLALVPLMAVVFSIITAFPIFDQWVQQIQDFVFDNFVPTAGEIIQDYVNGFVEQASKLTIAGSMFLIVTALLLMNSIERAFNHIWRINTPRGPVSRFLIYWTALTVGPLLIGVSLAMTSYLLSLPFISEAADQLGFRARLLIMLPFLVAVIAFSLGYTAIPNRGVNWRHALLGGTLAAVLFEIAKRGFGAYVTNFPAYEQIYGAFATVPMFLIWIYLSWLVILLGATVTAALNSWEYDNESHGWPESLTFLLLLRLLGHLAHSQEHRRALTTRELHKLEPAASDDQIAEVLHNLQDQGVLHRTEDDAWLIAPAPESLSLTQLYRSGRYRLPDSRQRVPEGRDACAWYEALENAVSRLQDDLGRHLSPSLAQVLKTTPLDA